MTLRVEGMMKLLKEFYQILIRGVTK